MTRNDRQQRNADRPQRRSGDTDHAKGPTSIEGVEASDLPDKGRGSVETEPGHELARHLPHHTGEVADSEINTDIGIAGNPQIREADEEKFLGRHQGDK